MSCRFCRDDNGTVRNLWRTDYWKPGEYVYEAYVKDALARRTLIEFSCKLCGKKYRVKHNPRRPSETPFPSELDTAKDSKGLIYIKCANGCCTEEP